MGRASMGMGVCWGARGGKGQPGRGPTCTPRHLVHPGASSRGAAPAQALRAQMCPGAGGTGGTGAQGHRGLGGTGGLSRPLSPACCQGRRATSGGPGRCRRPPSSPEHIPHSSRSPARPRTGPMAGACHWLGAGPARLPSWGVPALSPLCGQADPAAQAPSCIVEADPMACMPTDSVTGPSLGSHCGRSLGATHLHPQPASIPGNVSVDCTPGSGQAQGWSKRAWVSPTVAFPAWAACATGHSPIPCLTA